jgi:hypothetical protein
MLHPALSSAVVRVCAWVRGGDARGQRASDRAGARGAAGGVVRQAPPVAGGGSRMSDCDVLLTLTLAIIAQGRKDCGRPLSGRKAQDMAREVLASCGIDWMPLPEPLP